MADPKSSPPLEVSGHYLGGAGEDYFKHQAEKVGAGSAIDARKFANFVRPTDTILDYGCGSGGILAMLPAAVKLGIEPNPAGRKFCAENFKDVQTFATIDQVADESVDMAISNHCLEHVASPVAVLREMRRVLKPGGRLMVFVPIDDWRTQRRYDPQDINHHLHTWTPLLFGHTLFEAGFTDIEVRVFTEAFPPRYDLLLKYLPNAVFHVCCWLMAVMAKRRQIMAVAKRAV